jgi:hypothetical protein
MNQGRQLVRKLPLVLGWEAESRFEDLVPIMMEADLRQVTREAAMPKYTEIT